jgi:nitroimidazol reductase NimA-like FMN-containing flavoprotein (pyridoxamine 5'-phosphate oxidase superfamily)
MSAEDDLYELHPEECWDLLRAQELGRLAFNVLDELHITPINYAVDDGTLLFRTAAGSKLFSVELGGEVAFEIDEIGANEATSVVVRGHARRLEEDEEHRAENVPLRPWLGSDKPFVVEIVPTEVKGRRYPLNRPWLHAETGKHL